MFLTPNGSLNRRLGIASHQCASDRRHDRVGVDRRRRNGRTSTPRAPGSIKAIPWPSSRGWACQVDATTLRAQSGRFWRGEQISWNYAGQNNNPYFQPIENSNSSDRDHVGEGGGSLSMTLQPWLTATAQWGRHRLLPRHAPLLRFGPNGWAVFRSTRHRAAAASSKGGFRGSTAGSRPADECRAQVPTCAPRADDRCPLDGCRRRRHEQHAKPASQRGVDSKADAHRGSA